jgi:hypothetical protein
MEKRHRIQQPVLTPTTKPEPVVTPREIIDGYAVPTDEVLEHWLNAPKEVEPRKKVFKDRLAYHGLDHLKPVKPPKKRKRGRPKKIGRPRKRREDPYRLSPSTRPGARSHTVSVPEIAYAQLKEMALFYELSLSQVVKKLAAEAFARATEESELIARIEASREKTNATTENKTDPPNGAKAPRRTHF